jgi:hypothetical protein
MMSLTLRVHQPLTPTARLGYGLSIAGTALVIPAVNAAIGKLAWWWMAHVLRPFSYA